MYSGLRALASRDASSIEEFDFCRFVCCRDKGREATNEQTITLFRSPLLRTRRRGEKGTMNDQERYQPVHSLAGGSHVPRNNSSHHFGFAFDRCASELALQLWLGSLSCGRSRPRADYRLDPRADG